MSRRIPGLDKGSTWSATERTRAKYQAIAAHGTAYGIGVALMELGLRGNEDSDGTA